MRPASPGIVLERYNGYNGDGGCDGIRDYNGDGDGVMASHGHDDDDNDDEGGDGGDDANCVEGFLHS